MIPTTSFLLLEAHFEGGDIRDREACVGVAAKIQAKERWRSRGALGRNQEEPGHGLALTDEVGGVKDDIPEFWPTCCRRKPSTLVFNNIVVPPDLRGMWSRTPGGCLKLQISAETSMCYVSSYRYIPIIKFNL